MNYVKTQIKSSVFMFLLSNNLADIQFPFQDEL